MTLSKMSRAGVLALALVATGTLAAPAQTAPAGSDGPAAQGHVERAQMRGDAAGHKGRHGFGGRGGAAMIATLFDQVDADGDDAVTQAEIDTFRAARVGAADASGDGALSIEEFATLYRAFTRARMVDAFQALDADGDGAIGAAEMDARFGSMVERMDRDGDGVLTRKDRGRRG